MSDPDLDLSVYYRIRWYKVLQPSPLHVGHRDNRSPISLAGPGPPSTLRRLRTKLLEISYGMTDLQSNMD